MKIIDLTYPIEEGMLKFDTHWHPPVSIKQLGSIDVEGRESRKIVLGTHTGTHVDAPLHFIKNGLSVDQIPLEKLIGEITILDFSYLGENASITKEMLKERKIAKKMLFRFGWGKHWGQKKFYQGYPYFTKEAAEFLVSKNVELLSYDTPSPDDSRIKIGTEQDSEIHKIFLKNNIILVEYLANLEKIQEFEDWNISVNPLVINGGDGSTARVYLFKQ